MLLGGCMSESRKFRFDVAINQTCLIMVTVTLGGEVAGLDPRIMHACCDRTFRRVVRSTNNVLAGIDHVL